MGSKRRLMDFLRDHLPHEINTFMDVFGGSGTVSMNVDALKIQLNDFHPELYKLYNYYISTPIPVIEGNNRQLLGVYGDGERLSQEGFHTLRSVYNSKPDRPVEELNLLLYYAFQSLLRFNQQGEFNTSYNNARGKIPKDYYKKIALFQSTLTNMGVETSNRDFRNMPYEGLKEGDFVYMDPPYYITTAVYNKYWHEQDERDLYKLLTDLDERGVYFGLSNVLTHQGQTNQYLLDFINDHPQFDVYETEMVYSSRMDSEWQGEVEGSDEVYVTNYKKPTGGWYGL